MIVEAVGWDLPIDESGNWKKYPVGPENCNSSQMELLSQDAETEDTGTKNNPDYLNEWLDD